MAAALSPAEAAAPLAAGDVGGIMADALFFFVTELFPVDVTAILVMVLLMVSGPDGVVNFTDISADEGLAGFASPATITVLAMLILSSRISRRGVVQILGRRMASFAGDDLDRQLLATVGIAGPVSGFVNNTPVIAILVPVVSDVAPRGEPPPRSSASPSPTP